MNRLVAVGMVLAVCGSASAALVQWSSAVGGNDHWYEVRTVELPATAISWATARDDAWSRQGYLATLTSAAENQWVYDTFNMTSDLSLWWLDPAGNYQGPWIGGYQTDPFVDEPSGYWAWISGEAWGWTAWDPGEPNDYNGSEHCLQFFYDTTDGHEPVWNDAPNNSGVVAWVVEYNVPEPATLGLMGLGESQF